MINDQYGNHIQQIYAVCIGAALSILTQCVYYSHEHVMHYLT